MINKKGQCRTLLMLVLLCLLKLPLFILYSILFIKIILVDILSINLLSSNCSIFLFLKFTETVLRLGIYKEGVSDRDLILSAGFR